MNPCRCLIVLALSLLLVGCNAATKSDSRLVPPGAEFRTGLPLEPGYAQQFGYSHRWSRSLNLTRGQSIFAIEHFGDLIVTVERPQNVITALNADNGSLAWKTVVGEPLEEFYGPMANDEFVFVSSTRRLFKLLRRNGNPVEVYNLPMPVNMTPLLVDNMAIFGSVSGKVFGFDIEDGYRKWTYALKSRILSTPVLDGETIFVADSVGRYVNLTANDGELRWRGSTYGPVLTDPVLSGSDIVVASSDQSLYSLAANTGEYRWPVFRSEVPLTQTPTVIDQTIYLIEPGVGLVAIDAETGQALWNTETFYQPVTQAEGHLIAYADKEFRKLEPTTGKIVQTVPSREIKTILAGPSDSLLLITPKGEIMRIDPQR